MLTRAGFVFAAPDLFGKSSSTALDVCNLQAPPTSCSRRSQHRPKLSSGLWRASQDARTLHRIARTPVTASI